MIKNLYKIIAILSILPNFVFAQSQYISPIGIPQPSFGINESVNQYKLLKNENCENTVNKCYIYDEVKNIPYRLNKNLEPYTYYIDTNNLNSSDQNNPFGTVDKPRLTFPKSPISAGSIIEIQGKLPSIDIFALGTKERPVYIRGESETNKGIIEAANPDKTNNIKKGSSYLIIENILFKGRGIKLSQNSHHIVLRNSEVTGQLLLKDGHARSVNSIAADSKWKKGEVASDIVFYKNQIHDNGSNEGWPPKCDCGIHGLSIGESSYNVWVIDNQIYRNSEDGIHVIDFNKRGAPKNIYIARNKIFDNGENAVDIKQADNIIVSQNEMHTYRPTLYKGGSDGTALVINNEANRTPTNVWIIFNNIYNSTIGIRSQADKEYYIVGNNFYNIHNFGSKESNAGYVMTFTTAKEMHVINNTLKDFDGGINIANGGLYHIINNIIEGDILKGYYHLGLNRTKTIKYEVKNNLISSNQQVKIRNDKYFKCENCILNVKPKSNNYINNGYNTDIYDKFFSKYNININFDFTGLPRVIDQMIDIGANEFNRAK